MKSTLMRPESVTAEEALAIAQEAYVYLYPLVLMDVTRKQMINADPKSNVVAGPPNAFTHVRAFPPLDFRVTLRPSFDTLYSTAWLDLRDGPVIVSTGDTGGRYFLLPMFDMWTDCFAAPGKRTTGTGAADFAVIPPGWTGALPEGLEPIHAPTPNVLVLGRTQTNGRADYDNVHAIQDGYRIVRLMDWGKSPRTVERRVDPSVDTKTPPMKQVAAMDALVYFTYGIDLMKINGPHLTDWSMNARMKRIGLEPGRYDATKVDAAILRQGAIDGWKLMQDRATTLFRRVNGWNILTEGVGVYGDDYLRRAVYTMILGTGGNQPEDSIYPYNVCDADGAPMTAEHAYVMHFNRDEIPPVGGFWSLSMYDAEGFPVANRLDRYAIGDRDALTFNADGSLDLYIGYESPGAEKESNWLPGPPSGTLSVTLRLYEPKPHALDGRWNPPAIRRVK